MNNFILQLILQSRRVENQSPITPPRVQKSLVVPGAPKKSRISMLERWASYNSFETFDGMSMILENKSNE